MNLKSGTLLQGGRYRIIDTLGRGGFGITYLAELVTDKRKVCIKEFFPKDFYNRDDNARSISLGSKGSADIMNAYRDKFIKETRIIASLNHANIIRINEVFEENNTAYYVMEYIDGMSLSDLVKRRGPLPEAEAIKYIRAVAAALNYIHNRKIMHLDIKPANIMLRKDDGSAILIDFGLSKHYDAEGNQTSSTPVGVSHGFAPLEQYKSGGVKEFSPSTDIYSLGATLYYLVTGQTPPEAADVADDGLPALPAHLSQGVRLAIERSMIDKRKQRLQSVKDFLAILANNNGGVIVDKDTHFQNRSTKPTTDKSTVIDSATPKPKPKQKPKKRKKYLWLALAGLVITAVVAFFIFFGLKEQKTDLPDFSPSDEIWYISSSDKVIEPYKQGPDIFGAKIIYNTYEDGKGVIKFDRDVTMIGEYAFYDCDITDIAIPSGITEIGEGAFCSCNLTSVTIPNSVKTIGDYAFSCCGLTSVTIPNSVKTIGEDAFSDCDFTSVTIPNSVKTIGDGAFAYCDNLTSVTIPNSVTTIGDCAFFSCENLTSVTIPNSVKTIGDYAFEDCDNLTSVTIPNSVTTIGKGAFSDCDELTSVTIPNSVKTIGDDAFSDCGKLSRISRDKIGSINSKAL